MNLSTHQYKMLQTRIKTLESNKCDKFWTTGRFPNRHRPETFCIVIAPLLVPKKLGRNSIGLVSLSYMKGTSH